MLGAYDQAADLIVNLTQANQQTTETVVIGGEASELKDMDMRQRLIEQREIVERAKREGKRIVYISQEDIDRIDPAMLCKYEEAGICIFIPSDMKAKLQSLEENTQIFELTSNPYMKALTPYMHDCPHVKGGRYHKPPQNLRKKRKAKRRQQNQARRKR